MAVEMFVIDEWHSIQPQQEIIKEKPPHGHELADDQYHMPAPLDMLLGAEVWANTVGSLVYLGQDSSEYKLNLTISENPKNPKNPNNPHILSF